MVFKSKGSRVSGWTRAALVALLLGSGGAWAQSVANPGFETGTLLPWAATFAGGFSHYAAVGTTVNGVPPHAGTYFAYAYDNDGIGRVSQDVATVAGRTYTVSVWVTRSESNPANVASIRLGVANTPVACTLAAPAVWSQCTGSFTATAASERLDLLFGTATGAGIIAFDDVTVEEQAQAAVQPVPTLSEWALLALAAAAGGLGVRRLRRRV